MSFTADGMLVYGYDLGCDPRSREAYPPATAEDNDATGADLDDDQDGDETDDGDVNGLMTRMYRRLYESIPDQAARDDDGDHQDAVRKTLGVWIHPHGHHEYPGYFLVAYAMGARQGEAEVLDLPTLIEAPAAGNWDQKLAHGLSALGLMPTRETAAWLLASDWG